jgi:hypothetical protein
MWASALISSMSAWREASSSPLRCGTDGLVDDAKRVELLEVVGGQRRDADASVELRLHEALALQQPERLPDRAAAHAEVLGDLHLREFGAGGHPPLQDRRSQLAVDRGGVIASANSHRRATVDSLADLCKTVGRVAA